MPCLALVVSGGHTSLYEYRSVTELSRLASTLDDAAGEAFDKVAWLLGLGYPGGPSVAALAQGGDPTAFEFPRYRPKDGSLGFSFSGLKTAVARHVQRHAAEHGRPLNEWETADVCASFQRAVVDALVERAFEAFRLLQSMRFSKT